MTVSQYAWRFTREVLVFFEISHPVWPILGDGTACRGPGVGGIEGAMPLESPEFLQPHLFYGPVHEQDV